MKSYITYIILFFWVTLGYANDNAALNKACYQSGAIDYNQTAHLMTDGYMDTWWEPLCKNNQWAYVDLQQLISIDQLILIWGTVIPDYQIEYSAENTNNPIQWNLLPVKKTTTTELKHSDKNRAQIQQSIRCNSVKLRYLRISINKSKKGSRLYELEIPANTSERNLRITPNYHTDNKYYLVDKWVVAPAKYMESQRKWIPAKVPGTVLNSYLSYGALANPNYGSQQLMISESFFNADFIYRTEFLVPDNYSKGTTYLNFDGVSWKGKIKLNGKELGLVEGVYKRHSFDVSSLLNKGENKLEVYVISHNNPGVATEQHLGDPGANGGIIGLDSPTMLASIGWNWMPTIRGRNMGIWNHVYLSHIEEVSINNTFISTQLSDTTKAALFFETELCNPDNQPRRGILTIETDGKQWQKELTLNAYSKLRVKHSYKEDPTFCIDHPRLWWPNGYGKPELYDLQVSWSPLSGADTKSNTSDIEKLKFGVRQLSYQVENNTLRILVNGVPIQIRGGNWGMPDAMMLADSSRLELFVELHREMNMNMIRNWIGMTGDEFFYEACDRHGIMIWDDFWLANPVDGPHPENEKLFIECVQDKIVRLRNHPSIALWCGRNEGFPPATLDSAMNRIASQYDGTRYYISHSAAAPVSGLGPYETKDPKWYFRNRGFTLHSEQGIVVPPTIESFKQMMPPSDLWPISDMWGKHDWTQERVKIFEKDMAHHFGEPTDLADFCNKAQMMNTEGCKALFEAWRGNGGPGVLLWMSHPAWPSLICQTYDYYLEPTAAFYAFRNASKPLHILWRADNEEILVANDTRNDISDLSATVGVYDITGKLLKMKRYPLNIAAGDRKRVANMNEFLPENIESPSAIQFIRLKIEQGDKLLDENFYWRANEYQNYQELTKIKEPSSLKSSLSVLPDGKMIFRIRNEGRGVALHLRLIPFDTASEERILPFVASDNYFSLLPGEEKEVEIRFPWNNHSPETATLMFEGFNIPRRTVKKV